MIQTETVTIRNKTYTRTYSDTNMMIERDGNLYCEAIDPLGSGRIYIETSTKIEVTEGDLN